MKTPGPAHFKGNFSPTFNEVITPILFQALPENGRGENTFQLILRGQRDLDVTTKDVRRTRRSDVPHEHTPQTSPTRSW